MLSTLHCRTRILSLLLGGLTLGACGQDPILERADEEAASDQPSQAGASQSPGVPGQPPPGDPSQPPPGAPGQVTPGTPDEPQPGQAVQPPPGAPPMPEGQEARPGEQVPSGPTVKLTGLVRYPVYKTGAVRVDVFDGDQRDFSARPSVVAVAMLGAPGVFSVDIPQSVGRVWISAFNDANSNNRPDKEDPTGFYGKNPVSVADGPVEGIVIDLELRLRPDDGS